MEEDAPSLLTSALLTPLHFELPHFPVVCNLSLARVTLEDAPPLETVGDVFRPHAHATSEDGPLFGNHGRRILDW